MSNEERVEALRMKHASIEEQIDQENQRPHPDDLLISELKREKLRIKDQIAVFAGGS